MMRRAGTPPEQMNRSISKSYCSAYCLEGQISIGLSPVAPAHAPASSFGVDEPYPATAGICGRVSGR
jgi:hypothetical protein